LELKKSGQQAGSYSQFVPIKIDSFLENWEPGWPLEKLLLVMMLFKFDFTVKPVYNGHPWDLKIVAV
jgi:hypothetical protein